MYVLPLKLNQTKQTFLFSFALPIPCLKGGMFVLMWIALIELLKSSRVQHYIKIINFQVYISCFVLYSCQINTSNVNEIKLFCMSVAFTFHCFVINLECDTQIYIKFIWLISLLNAYTYLHLSKKKIRTES